MKKERRVPIFFACDENFVKYTVVALESMIANASTERKYIIHGNYSEPPLFKDEIRVT